MPINRQAGWMHFVLASAARTLQKQDGHPCKLFTVLICCICRQTGKPKADRRQRRGRGARITARAFHVRGLAVVIIV